MKAIPSIAVALLLAACASNPPEPRAVDPVGAFDFTTAVDGTAVQGTVTVTRMATGMGGTITTNVTQPVDIRTVTVDGQVMTVVADTPDGPVTMVLTFEGDRFTGTWSLAGQSGTLSGTRRGSGG